jgi:crossover junction endodeoxyribonuclease RusA
MSSLSFFVVGTPAPQGSKRHVGNGIMVESSKALKPWRATVAGECAERIAADPAWEPIPSALARITFYFRRPKSHYRTGRNSHILRDDAPTWHTNNPDVDKLQRGVFDALAEAGAIGDDCRIARVLAMKIWADADQPTGAMIEVHPS